MNFASFFQFTPALFALRAEVSKAMNFCDFASQDLGL